MGDCISDRQSRNHANVPDDTDVLITHSPAFGILDFDDGINYGSEEIHMKLSDLYLKAHLFGHIHRIKDLSLTDKSFNYPKDFVPADYFHDVFGIIAGINRKVENIVIRTYAELPGYLRSLPIHHSQKELETKDGHTDFSLTFDFIQELLLHRDQLELIAPQSLREEIYVLISKMRKLYVSPN